MFHLGIFIFIPLMIAIGILLIAIAVAPIIIGTKMIRSGKKILGTLLRVIGYVILLPISAISIVVVTCIRIAS